MVTTFALTSQPSAPSLAAALLYLLVVIACIAAGLVAARSRQQRWHLRTWAVLALLFAALAMLRIYGVEEALRADLRLMLQADGIYSQRRSFQRPIAAALVVLIAMGVAVWIFLGFRHGRGRRDVAVMIARASAFAMIGVISLRLVSLSPIDKLLYGPLKFNWIIDLGSSLGVLASAGYYVWKVRRGAVIPGRERGLKDKRAR